MKRAIVILAAAFCGWVFAISVPSARHLDPALQLASKVSLAWIGFYCIYNSLRRRRRSTRLPDQEVARWLVSPPS
jgi:ABC-type nickel/cobalt efflux system permease component RcnA